MVANSPADRGMIEQRMLESWKQVILQDKRRRNPRCRRPKAPGIVHAICRGLSRLATFNAWVLKHAHDFQREALEIRLGLSRRHKKTSI